MRKSYLYYTVAVFALLAVTIESCKKEDGFNNNTVIETPYGLYFADSSGALFNTNNGDTIKPMVFGPDGYAPSAIAISGLNLLFLKRDLQISTNNGVNFNTTYSTPNTVAANQSAILTAGDENRMYLSIAPVIRTSDLGLAYSDSNGQANTWVPDNYYDSSSIQSLPVNITTLAQMKNNVIVGYAPGSNRVFAKYGKTNKWVERTGDNSSTTNLPTNNNFTLGHFNNTLVAIDNSGLHGAWYSNDTGTTWTKYTSLPSTRLYAVSSPFDQVLLIGTDGFGIYRLNNGIFIPSNAGIVGTGTIVRGIAGKENIYKNSTTTVQQYIYIATNNGLYRSQDFAQSWSLVQLGNFVAAY